MRRVGATQILSSMRHRKGAYASLVLEVALGCTVAAYSIGLSRGIHQIAHSSLGFDVERTFSVVLDRAIDGHHERRTTEELNQLLALPDVEAAAFTEQPPLSRGELPETMMTPSGPRLAYSLRGDANLAHVLGIRPRIGRGLRAGDLRASGPTPVLITDALARTLGPRPLGASLSSPGLGSLTVVGVVGDPLRLGPFFSAAQGLVIVPRPHIVARRNTYIVRARAGAADDFARVAAAELRARDPSRYVAVERLADTSEHLLRNLGGADIVIFITVFGVALVVLVGSLGMASSLVVERARQIGIRRALGARRSDILGYFMIENLIATSLGLALSVALCELLDRALGSLRGEIVILWPEYIVPAAALFLVSGQLAVLLPAHRAAQIEPSVASRAA